jgi:GTP-binding protein Era
MSSPSGPESAAPHRCGHVAIVGRPNVGKSTLLNRLIGAKVSITSPRPQTTRHRITGILTRPGYQIVFVDTPGYQTEFRSPLNRMMNRAVSASVEEVDAVLWMVEALRLDARDREVERLLPRGVPVVLAINKTDRVKDKQQLLPFIAECSALRDFHAIVPVSAKLGAQVEELVEVLVPLLPEGPRLYEEDEITTLSERFLAAELLREKLFLRLGEELPYATTVEIEQFRQEGALRRIQATILVDKETQKPIVIGRGGARLKAIASEARRDMEALFGGKVYLEVWVKVRPGWAENEALLQRLGHGG